MSQKPSRVRTQILIAISIAILLAAAFSRFGAPLAIAVRDLGDDGLGAPGVPQHALELHRSLSERLPTWARERIASGDAARENLYDVPRTEWPIFTAVFYLNATESLHRQGVDVTYSNEAVQASRDLIMDPNHHSWVQRHWGDDYLHDNNVFFRSLLISGLTSYCQLAEDGCGQDLDFLRDQVETLAAALDESPHGVLEDYPMETYPIDVLAAVAYIRRADPVLGTDHSAFVQRARRGFVAPYDDELGLVRFRVDLRGDAFPSNVQPGRGIGNSWVGIYTPELWPDDARRWHQTHTEHFWADHGWAIGFREHPAGGDDLEWGFEIDAGPVLDGFGTSASAFGIGAARRNGRFDQAYTLSAQMAATAWPIADGELLFPQLFSIDAAPLLSEAALVYFLTIEPAPGVEIVRGGQLTPLVFFALGVYLVGFLVAIWVARSMAMVMRKRRWQLGAGRQLALLVVIVAASLGALASPFLSYFIALAAFPLAIGRKLTRREEPTRGDDPFIFYFWRAK